MEAGSPAEFIPDVASLADQALGSAGFDEDACARLLAAVELRVQATVGPLRLAGEPAPACTRGCAACCTVNVGALALEGAAAAAYLRRRLRPEEVPGRAADLLGFHDRVRWQEDGERIRARDLCPFLEAGGGCSIHPVRPLACRALSSLDAEDCRLALLERAEGDGPGLVRQNLLQKELYEEAGDALAEALARRGLDTRRRDVSGMVGAFLAHPSLAAAFAAGVRLPID